MSEPRRRDVALTFTARQADEVALALQARHMELSEQREGSESSGTLRATEGALDRLIAARQAAADQDDQRREERAGERAWWREAKKGMSR